MKVNKQEIVEQYIGSVFLEQAHRDLDPKHFSKHRRGNSFEAIPKNIWMTEDFVDDDDEVGLDREGINRSRSI
jgi:hypothetical protein